MDRSFATDASGTYNNQWLVLDVTRAAWRLAHGMALQADTFWVLEEVPGLVHAEDQSDHVRLLGGPQPSPGVPSPRQTARY